MAQQLHLFRAGASQLDEVICWTRMQAEGGQTLEKIILRKEIERRAGDGVFFWGIGNSLGQMASSLVSESVPVLFSKMLSAPKREDASPNAILVWTAFALGSIETALPPSALVLSRANTAKGPKRRHYALVCGLSEKLELSDSGPIDHEAYRNVGGRQQPVGSSQVTAILRRWREENPKVARYRIDMRAHLCGPQFVRLTQPRLLRPAQLAKIEEFESSSARAWLKLVKQIRAVSEPFH